MPKPPGVKVTLKKRAIYPHNLDYHCKAFPLRRGFIAVQRDPPVYELYEMAPGNTYELLWPPVNNEEDGYINLCKKHNVGPDMVMLDDYVYTNYIKLS